MTTVHEGAGMNDEEQIRGLIERWTTAVHVGDLPTVLADHADDIVMFDVPPPEQGVRGIDAYRDTWPGFFEWQAHGAVFDIEALDVTAGADAAFALALLRCGTPAEFDRDRTTGAAYRRLAQARWPLGGHARAPLVRGQDLSGAIRQLRPVSARQQIPPAGG
jgi:ketosteroid isomerase-like protein